MSSNSLVVMQRTETPLHSLSLQTGDVDRVDRLWQLLCLTYPIHNLIQCLSLPDPYTQKTLLMLATEERMPKVVNWLIDNGAEFDGMARVS